MNVEEYERYSKGKLKASVSDALSTKAYGDDVFTLNMLGSSTMSPQKALRIEAFHSCVRDKAESIGQLPLRMFRTVNGVREQVKSGRMHRIFTQRPCEYLTWQGFNEMMVASVETNGAFFAYVNRNDRGNISEIIPFRHQSNVVPNMDIFGNVYYTYTTNDGKYRDPYRIEDLVVVKNFTVDGYTVISPVRYMGTLLGIADAQEESYKELQQNGITSQMALATDGIFNDDKAIARLKDDWSNYRGPKGRRKIPILEQGLKPVSLKLTPAELDLLGHREFTVDRICRMTRVLPHRVGVQDKGSKSSLAELDEMYMRNSLNPLMVKLENELNRISPEGIGIEFNRKAFYAGSPWRLIEAVEKEVKGGLASINEGREDLGRESVEGGDVFAVDNNNVFYSTWDKREEAQQQIYNQNNPTQENPSDEK